MSGRKTADPSTPERDEQLDPSYGTTSFASGIIRDEADADLPGDALADGFNVIVFPQHVEGRPGCELFTDLVPPRIAGTDTFSASKSGEFVDASSGPFTRAHVSNYVVFPGDELRRYEIVRYISATRVQVDERPTEEELVVGCYLSGKQNIWDFHRMSAQWVMQFYKQLYLRDRNMDTQQQVLTVSRTEPNNSIGNYGRLDRYAAFIFNSGGMFKVQVTEELPKAFQVNINVPSVRIADDEQTDDTLWQYGMLYSAARLSGVSPLRTRLDPIRIEMQTGPVAWDPTSRQDYADLWTADPIGPGDENYGLMRCGPIDNEFITADGWADIAPDFGTFVTTINDIGPHEVGVDLADVRSLAEVAQRIQGAMQDFWPLATCTFVPNANEGVGHLLLTGGRVAGGSVTYLEAGTTGTDISAAMQGREADTPRIYTAPTTRAKVVGPLWVPQVPNTDPVEYEWHLTHFPIYRTRDKNNQYQEDQKAATFHNPDRYIWEHDLRICAAFYVCRRDGIITALNGKFEPQDEGSTLLYDNGERDELGTYIDEYHMTQATDYYYGGGDLCPAAAAIGNGRVMRASQTGNRVTRTHGDEFAATDERKTIHWSSGRRSYVRSILPADLPPDPVLLSVVLDGVPREVTSLDWAAIQVGGEGVTQYRYELDGAGWSEARSMSSQNF